MNRLRPQITGIAVGLSIAIFGGLADARRPPAVAVRWLAAGTGLAFLATHWLQRFDESADSRRRDRRTKLKILNRHLKNQASGQHRVLADKNLEPDTMFGDETIAAHHSTPETFVSNEFVNLSPSESFGDLAADLRLAFDSAVETNQWSAAIRTYHSGQNAGNLLDVDEPLLAKIRAGALQDIFQRMQSGSVREDVAQLAEDLVEIFPNSKEGLTLGPVMGVLRRSAGLCPRCSLPYRGIANACHDCLRGTPEAYQIAWDEEGVNPQPK